jgi:hypothetical protein
MDRGKTVYPLPLPVERFCSYSLSIDITEEGSDVGDDSDDGDFEPSLNFTLRFVMLISYVSVVTYILEISSSDGTSTGLDHGQHSGFTTFD